MPRTAERLEREPKIGEHPIRLSGHVPYAHDRPGEATGAVDAGRRAEVYVVPTRTPWEKCAIGCINRSLATTRLGMVERDLLLFVPIGKRRIVRSPHGYR